MALIFFLLVFLSFPMMYKYNRTGYYIYSLLFPYVGFFILNKIGYSLSYTIMNAQSLAIIFIALLWRQFLRRGKFYIIYISIFLIYFFFDSVIQGVSYFSRWNTYKTSLIFMIWGVMLIDDIKNRRISILRLRHFFVLFLIIEVALGFLQNVFEPIRDFFRNVDYMSQGEVVEVRDLAMGGFMRGTFRGVSTYANFLCDAFAICATYYFWKGRLGKWQLILLCSTIIIILFAGIRISLLLSILILIVLMVKYKQRRAVLITLAFLISIVTISGYSFDRVQNVRDVSFEEGGAVRSLSILNSFQGNTLEEESTMAMTINMLPHVMKNPLFGIGLHNQGGYELARWGQTLEDFSFSDAMLTFIIAEIGIIGLVIYLWPLWYFIKQGIQVGANKYNYILLLIFMILTTVLDSGLMSYNYLLLYFFAIVFFIGKTIPAQANLQNL